MISSVCHPSFLSSAHYLSSTSCHPLPEVSPPVVTPSFSPCPPSGSQHYTAGASPSTSVAEPEVTQTQLQHCWMSKELTSGKSFKLWQGQGRDKDTQVDRNFCKAVPSVLNMVWIGTPNPRDIRIKDHSNGLLLREPTEKMCGPEGILKKICDG